MEFKINGGMVINNQTGEVVALDNKVIESLCQEYAQYRVIRDSAIQEMDQIGDIIKAYMGTKTEMTTDSHKITYKEVTKTTVDSTKLKKELPSVYSSYSKTTVCRPLCIR